MGSTDAQRWRPENLVLHWQTVIFTGKLWEAKPTRLLETENWKLVKLELSKLGKLDVLETGGVAVDARRRQRERGHRCCQYSNVAYRPMRCGPPI